MMNVAVREYAVYMEAAENGDIETVQRELAAGVHVDARTMHYCMRTALMQAAREGHFNLVKYLLSKGADKTLREDAHQRNAFDMASMRGHHEVAAMLAKK